MTSVSKVILYSLNWTIFLDLNVKEYLNSISTVIKLVDGQKKQRIIHIAASIREKTSMKCHEEKVQLAINLGLKTSQIVGFVSSNSSTL